MTKYNFRIEPSTSPSSFLSEVKPGDVIYNSKISEDRRWYAIVLERNSNDFKLLVLDDRAYCSRIHNVLLCNDGWAIAKNINISLSL